MQADTLDASRLSAMAREIYRQEPSALIRFTQRYRPYICPFEEVMEQVPPGARVLDVGCGSGLFLLLLASSGRISHGFGFDASEPAVAAAAAAARNAGLDLEFVVRSIEMGIPREDFTVVSVVDVLHHVPLQAQQEFVAALCAAVPQGGRLIIKDMVARPRWRAFANRCHDALMARQWVHQIDADKVEVWARECGFDVVHRGRSDRLVYGHWMLVLERGGGA